MIWKKSVFSYLIWLLYAIALGFLMLCQGTAASSALGIDVRFGAVFTLLAVAAASATALGLRRLSCAGSPESRRAEKVRLVGEVSLAALFLLVGLALRIWGIDETEETFRYFELAGAGIGQEAPELVHGASYFYVQVLGGVLRLFGNRYFIGVILQIILQYLGAAGLYFVLRRSVGAAGALTTLGFVMLSPYTIAESLTLSPYALFFCLLVLGAGLTVLGAGKKKRSLWLLLAGFGASLAAYADVAGLLLLAAGLAAAFCECGGERKFLGKLTAGLGFLLGYAAGFAAWLGLDALLSGKGFAGVAGTWARLYFPGSFSAPLTAGAGESWLETGLLLLVMGIGVFSFWFDFKRERLTPAVLGAGLTAAGCCFGVFTREMPGEIWLFLLFAITAGVGLEQCLTASGKEETAPAEEAWENMADSHASSLSRTVSLEEQAAYREEQELFAAGQAAKEQSAGEREQTFAGEQTPSVQYIDNPLPLPRKHVKKVLDFDYEVAEDDDFDI